MADDGAGLLAHFGIERADVFGFSMGGGAALQLAIRHPAAVRKLVVASASYRSDGMHAVALEMFPSITPEMFAGSPIEEAYLRVAPHPGDFPTLARKLTELDTTPTPGRPTTSAGSPLRRSSSSAIRTASASSTWSRCSSCSAAA